MEVQQPDPDRLLVAAPGADLVQLERLAPRPPDRRRGVPDPYRASAAADRLDIPAPPEGGWYLATAVWKGLDVQTRRLYLPPRQPAGLHSRGLHPAPDDLQLRPDAAPLVLRDGGRVLLSDPALGPVADLLVAEVERLVGVRLKRVARPARLRMPGDIALTLTDAVDGSGGDAFRLEVSGRGAVVSAGAVRGVTYGALALADLLAAGRGEVAAMTVTNAPDVVERPLLHQLNLGGRGALDVAVWSQFLRQVVLRGRYNQLYLGLLDSYRFESRPGVGHRDALSRAEVQGMIDEARALGLEVFPAVSAPGNASWVTAGDAGLRSSGNPRQICPRDPAVQPLLAELYGELWALFGEPGRVHIGHDELRFEASALFGDERDPYCAGVPTAVLLGESLRWHIDHFAALGAEVVAWDDMLSRGWNGAQGEAWRAAAALDPARLRLASWGPAGDNVREMLDLGFRVQRIHTGYYDWKRAGLPELRGELDGEGMALFHPFPWAAFGVNPGTRPLGYHWSRVLLAGATAWRSDLAEAPIADTLHHAALAGLPAYQPGRGGGLRRNPAPLLVTGRPDPRLPAPPALPPRLEAGEMAFPSPQWVVARPDEPVQISVERAAEGGLSLLVAAALDRAALQRLLSGYREPLSGPPVAEVRVRYADGEESAVIIDTGGPTEPLLERIRTQRLTLTHVLCTHHHPDHVAHNGEYRDAFGCPVCGHAAERELFAASIGGALDQELRDGDEIPVGGLRVRALHIPGHTVGQLGFLVNDGACVFTGDTLFRGSVGGTRGRGHTSFDDLRTSVLDTLLALPGDCVVYPGHMEATTIAREAAENPFVQAWRASSARAGSAIPCEAFGTPGRLLLEAPDYDGGTKAWVRFDDGREDVVPGSRVTRPGA